MSVGGVGVTGTAFLSYLAVSEKPSEVPRPLVPEPAGRRRRHLCPDRVSRPRRRTHRAASFVPKRYLTRCTFVRGGSVLGASSGMCQPLFHNTGLCSLWFKILRLAALGTRYRDRFFKPSDGLTSTVDAEVSLSERVNIYTSPSPLCAKEPGVLECNLLETFFLNS